jgi:hypothetical protein
MLKSFIKTIINRIISNTTVMSLIMSFAISQMYIWLINNKRKFIGGKFDRKEIFKNKLLSSYSHMIMRHRFYINSIVSRNGTLAIRLKEINTIKKMNLPKPFYGVMNKVIHNILRIKY